MNARHRRDYRFNHATEEFDVPPIQVMPAGDQPGTPPVMAVDAQEEIGRLRQRESDLETGIRDLLSQLRQEHTPDPTCAVCNAWELLGDSASQEEH